MLLTNLEILSMVPGEEPFRGSLRIRDGKIAATGNLDPEEGEEVHDLGGLTALPGFVQGHVHLCQTLFRNLAEDLPLLPWLSSKIWPMEAAHDEESLRASARLALTELILGGSTTFQGMETLRNSEVVFAEVLASGLRGILGNCLMDLPGPGLPRSSVRSLRENLEEAERLRADWDGREGRIHFAFSPRFLLCCSRELLGEVGRLRREEGCRVHTHASEHPAELEAVRKHAGRPYLFALDEEGLLGPETSLAHCVHLDSGELDLLVERKASVLHCPTTNLKLGSGIAPLLDFLDQGIPVALGSDGAPANNRLDSLTELRLARLLVMHGVSPSALPAREALSLLTSGGAKALGLDGVCGTLEPGKAADICLLDLDSPLCGPGGDAFEKLAGCADRGRIRHLMAEGRWLMKDGRLLGDLADTDRTLAEAKAALGKLLLRLGR